MRALSNNWKRADLSEVCTPDVKPSLSAGLFLSLLFLFSAGCAPYLVVSRGVINRDKYQEVKNGVEALRGLRFKEEVAVEIKNREEMRRYLEDDLELDYGGVRLANMAVAYGKLGLFPQGIDLKKSVLDFLGTQVAAFYDPRTKRMVFPEDLGGGMLLGTVQFIARRDIVGEVTLAHELTHALQDQHFSLEEKMAPSDNDDKSLAFYAVAEGDATLSGFGYLSGGLDKDSLARIDEALHDGSRTARAAISGVPEAVVEELLFRYYGGVSFVGRSLALRGWTGVNALFSSPPLSTEQVLHPEKYFELPDPPTRIKLRDLSSLFQPGWKEIENNVLGELMIGVLFKQWLTEEEAGAIAAGWDGDRFVAFRRDGEVAFVWASVWDSPGDAEEFVQGYRRLASKKYPGRQSPGPYTIERRDDRVLVLEGLESDRIKDRVEEIWQGMELKEEPFKSPFP